MVVRIDIKVMQVCLSLAAVGDKNKGQQNMKDESVH